MLISRTQSSLCSLYIRLALLYREQHRTPRLGFPTNAGLIITWPVIPHTLQLETLHLRPSTYFTYTLTRLHACTLPPLLDPSHLSRAGSRRIQTDLQITRSRFLTSRVSPEHPPACRGITFPHKISLLKKHRALSSSIPPKRSTSRKSSRPSYTWPRCDGSRICLSEWIRESPRE